jgi:hypothetical protein
MTLWQIITTARDRYLTGYRATLREQRDKLPNLRPEVLVRPHGIDPEKAEYATFRVDLMWGDDRKPEVGKLGSGQLSLNGPPHVTDYPDGSRLLLESFAWDDCELRVSPSLADDSVVRQWCVRWIDREERNTPDEDGLRSAIHAVAPPNPVEGGTLLYVDFGSAPPDAFTSLIAALVADGPKTIRVTAAATTGTAT